MIKKAEKKVVEKKIEDVKEVKVEEAMEVEYVSLISLEEFVRTLLSKRQNPVESLNSFMYWAEKKGCPRRWPFDNWQEKFDEFIKRPV